MWQIGDLLREAGNFLEQKGIPSPRLEAELLLAHSLSIDRVGLYTRFRDPLDDGEVGTFREFCKRRIRGEPTAYITGRKEFFSLDFIVSPAVLIPRPETEELVQAALDQIDGDGKGSVIADVGTGSGCIAVTLSSLKKELRLVATDISRDALAVAEKNARRHGVWERVDFLEGDLAEPLRRMKPDEGFHSIVCNPPYIDPDEDLEIESAVLRFEPREALLTPSGDPWRHYRKLMEGAGGLLVQGGMFLFEVGLGMAEEAAGVGREMGFDIALNRKDLAGISRVVGFRKKENRKRERE